MRWSASRLSTIDFWAFMKRQKTIVMKMMMVVMIIMRMVDVLDVVRMFSKQTSKAESACEVKA